MNSLVEQDFINFMKRESCEFRVFLLIVSVVSVFLRAIRTRSLMSLWHRYQLMDHDPVMYGILPHRFLKPILTENHLLCIGMDVICASTSIMKTSDGCALKFALLSRFSKLVLTLPHPNASEERICLVLFVYLLIQSWS